MASYGAGQAPQAGTTTEYAVSKSDDDLIGETGAGLLNLP